jgi:hypothetical protein
MAALPRLDHLAQLADDALQLRDPRIALAQRLLELGGCGRSSLTPRVELSIAAAETGLVRARPATDAIARRESEHASSIELNRYLSSGSGLKAVLGPSVLDTVGRNPTVAAHSDPDLSVARTTAPQRAKLAGGRTSPGLAHDATGASRGGTGGPRSAAAAGLSPRDQDAIR